MARRARTVREELPAAGLRWTNFLRPDIKRGRFSFQEDTIIQLHSILGNK